MVSVGRRSCGIIEDGTGIVGAGDAAVEEKFSLEGQTLGDMLLLNVLGMRRSM